MHELAMFFAGAFLCNAIPHIVSGLCGQPFPTPFAKPRGRGDSSPVVNMLWGAFNLIVGLFLLASAPVSIGLNAPFVTMLIGGLLMGVGLAYRFGEVQRSKRGA
jgi:hypothetical protein